MSASSRAAASSKDLVISLLDVTTVSFILVLDVPTLVKDVSMPGAIVSVANGRARGRVVSSLEGGYDLEALGRSALAHVRALQEG